MTQRKIAQREFSVPMLAMLIPVMNEAAELGFSFKMMVLVAIVACFYATLRVVQKTMELKYAPKTVTVTVPKPGANGTSQ